MSSTQPPTVTGAALEKPEKKTTKAVRGGAKGKSTKAAKASPTPPATRADEIIEALKAASRDKEIDFERLVAALEEAIATAARKVYKVREMGARFDQKTGTLTAWTPYRLVAEKTVKPEDVAAAAAAAAAALDPDDVPLGQSAAPAPAPAAPVDPDKEIRLPYIEVLPEEAAALLAGELAGQSWQVVRNPRGEESTGEESLIEPAEMGLGDEIRLYRSTEGLGRIAAQSAKQVLYQKVREAERDNIYNEYYPKLGELITGTVKRFERGDMIVDLGRTEAAIPREHQSRAERYTQGERVRGVLSDVHKNPKGSQIILSRTAPELLMRLMEMEVPEIYDGTVLIRGCVRQPGDRAKVAVSSRELSGIITHLAERRQPIKREVIERWLHEDFPSTMITPLAITKAVAAEFGVTLSALRSHRRTHVLLLPRQCAMWLSRKLCGTSFMQLGGFFERRHSSVMHSVRTLEQRLAAEPSLRQRLKRIESTIKVTPTQ